MTMSGRQRRLFAGAAVMAGAGLLVRFYLTPTFAEISRVDERGQQIRARIERQTTARDRLDPYRRRLGLMRKAAQEEDPSRFLARLERHVAAAGVRLASRQRAAGRRVRGLEAVAYQLRLSCSLQQLVRLLHRLENDEKPLRVEFLGVHRTPRGTLTVASTVSSLAAPER